MIVVRKGAYVVDLNALERQRTELRLEIVERLLFLHRPDFTPFRLMDPDDPGRALYTELERQLEEKRAQLRELDDRIEHTSAPRSRFREDCFRMRGILWMGAVTAWLGVYVCASVGRGWGLLMFLAACGMTAWAAWSSSPPST